MEKFGANPSPDGAHEIDPTGEFSADYFEDFSIGLDNIVEGLWKWLKLEVINNVFYYTVSEIRKNVISFMEPNHETL